MKLLVNSFAFWFLTIFICHISCKGNPTRGASDEMNREKALAYPWLASLQGIPCTGSIISKYVVLTAASCFKNVLSLSNITVKVGSSRDNDEISKHKLVALAKHDDYNESTNANNLALIKVSPGFEFGRDVNKIELASERYAVVSGTIANAIDLRWKITENTGLILQELVSNELHIAQRSSCTINIFDNQICANDVDRKSCFFNVGSPLVVNNILVAIRSNGDRFEGIYTQISSSRGWIDCHLQRLDSLSV